MLSACQRLGAPKCTPARRASAQLRPRRVLVFASGDDASLPATMTLDEARSVLGVPPTASFDEVVASKNKLLKGADQERAMQIDLAYDLLFNYSMRKRLSGELEVSTSVRYADVPAAPARGKSSSSSARPSLLPPKLPTPSLRAGMPVAVAAPGNKQVAATQAAVFGALGVWALIGALLESPEAQLGDTAGIQLAAALAYAVYSLRENKRMRLGKAVALTLAALVIGAALGTVVEAWLRVDIVPIGGFGSPGVLVAEFVIAACAAAAIFLV